MLHCTRSWPKSTSHSNTVAQLGAGRAGIQLRPPATVELPLPRRAGRQGRQLARSLPFVRCTIPRTQPWTAPFSGVGRILRRRARSSRRSHGGRGELHPHARRPDLPDLGDREHDLLTGEAPAPDGPQERDDAVLSASTSSSTSARSPATAPRSGDRARASLRGHEDSGTPGREVDSSHSTSSARNGSVPCDPVSLKASYARLTRSTSLDIPARA